MLNNLTIKSKMYLFILTPVILGLIFVVSFGTYELYTTSDLKTQESMLNLAKANGSEIENDLNSALDAASFLAKAMGSLIENGDANREGANNLIRKFPSKDTFFGAWVVIEPNQLDGKDDQYIDTPGNGPEGRFVPYWNKGGGELNLQSCNSYADDNKDNGWYIIARDSRKPHVMEPFAYEVSGKKVMMVTFAYPIFVNNKVVGAAGIDMSMDNFNSLTEKVKPFETGYAFLLSNESMFITHPTSTIVGKNIYDLDQSEKGKEWIKKIANGEYINDEKIANKTGELVRTLYVPVVIDGIDKKLSFAIAYPVKRSLAAVYQEIYFSIIISIIIILLIATIIYLVTRKITEDISLLSEQSNEISDSISRGDLSVSLDLDLVSFDFIPVAEAVKKIIDVFVAPIHIISNNLDHIAKGETPETIDTKQFEGGFKQMISNLNTVIEVVNRTVSEIGKINRSAEKSDFTLRASQDGIEGDWKDILVGVNKLMGISEDFLLKVNDNMEKVQKESELQAISSRYQKDEVNNLMSVLESMSDGDLTKSYTPGPIDSNLKDVKQMFDEISSAVTKTNESLNKVLSEVKSAADQIDSGSNQLSDASQSLSAGSTEQSSSLEELTATMTQISSQTRQNAENANVAAKLAVSAKDSAQTGNAQMSEMNNAMDQINESSQEIKKVIKVIDDIAFQTNLLALNAAVEAARAGIHGKGFAVVADEVRNLAQRSAEAAKETTELIEDSNKRVEKGSKISSETMKSLEEISVNVTKTVDLVEEIAVASEEQAKGIEQSNVGLTQVSTVTQSNAANAEETASAALELSSQSEALRNSISLFKLNNSFGYVENKRRAVPTQQRQKPISKPKERYQSLNTDFDDDEFGEF